MAEKTRSLGSLLRPNLSGDRSNVLPADAAAVGHPAEAIRKPHEELCPHCGRLNPVGREICADCGQKLPLESVKTLFQGKERQEILQEALKFGLLLVAVSVLVAISNFIPTTGRVLIILATIAFLIWRFLAKITDD
jgi:hypothetical protein